MSLPFLALGPSADSKMLDCMYEHLDLKEFNTPLWVFAQVYYVSYPHIQDVLLSHDVLVDI